MCESRTGEQLGEGTGAGTSKAARQTGRPKTHQDSKRVEIEQIIMGLEHDRHRELRLTAGKLHLVFYYCFNSVQFRPLRNPSSESSIDQLNLLEHHRFAIDLLCCHMIADKGLMTNDYLPVT